MVFRDRSTTGAAFAAVRTALMCGLGLALGAPIVSAAPGARSEDQAGALTEADTAVQAVAIFPGQNIQAIVDASPPGTTFLLKSGIHRGQTIRPRTGDTYLGEAGTILSGATPLTTIVRAGAWWATPGQTQDETRYRPEATRFDGWDVCQPGVARCSSLDQLFIDGQGLEHAGSLDQVGPGRFFFDYDADTIYFADDPTGHRVEISTTPTAFENTGDDVTISGLIVERYASTFSHGVIDGTDRVGWVVTNNEVRWNHSTGMRVGPRAVVRDNRVHHNGQLGIFASGDDVLVEDNEIAYNNLARYEVTYEAAGTKFVGTRNLVVRGNYSHHNIGPGLWSDLDNLDTLYEDNVSQDNEWMGIWYEVSYRATIRNNIIRRNGFAHSDWMWGAGILVAGSSEVEVSGNFVEGNADGIGGIEQDRGQGVFGPHEIWNLWVHDNTVIGTDGWTAGIVQNVSNPAVYSRNNRFDFNTYRLRPASQNGAPFTWMDGYRTAASWRGSGNDLSSAFSQPLPETVSFLSDRTFQSAASGWGPVERDRSNGEARAGDGRIITVAGVPYTRGLGVHAPSDLRFMLNGACSAFTAIVGIDGEESADGHGSAAFQVWTDGVLRYDSGVMTAASESTGVLVDTTGTSQLALVVTDGGDGSSYDHADWADAQVSCR